MYLRIVILGSLGLFMVTLAGCNSSMTSPDSAQLKTQEAEAKALADQQLNQIRRP